MIKILFLWWIVVKFRNKSFFSMLVSDSFDNKFLDFHVLKSTLF
jgi:hypothetical protein